MKIKCIFVSAIPLAIALGVGLALAGCASTRIKQLSGDAFLKQADQISQVSSFTWTSYVGISHQRAYLEYGHPAFIGKGVSTTVYWTPLAELPTNLVMQLKSGTPPWTNWADKTTTDGRR
jgi:hypothetical protein